MNRIPLKTKESFNVILMRRGELMKGYIENDFNYSRKKIIQVYFLLCSFVVSIIIISITVSPILHILAFWAVSIIAMCVDYTMC